MPLSTSSSDRPVPDQAWGRVGLGMVALAAAALLTWEIIVRSALGYGQSYTDGPLLWGFWRDRLKGWDENAVAIVGSSRIRFDLVHEQVSEAIGDAPIAHLAINGSVQRPVLHDLAQDPSFRGTVLVGYTPGLFWVPGGPNMTMTTEVTDKYPRRTPSDKASQYIAFLPQSVFAFLNKEDLALPKLLRETLALPNREGVMVPPRMPPYLAKVEADRGERMWEKLETDPEFQAEVQGIWKTLFQLAPPLPPELIAKERAEVAADVAAIRARGGDVIFIRFPSSGWIREHERENNPREALWDPLIEETGAVGIHFEDYPELSGYTCPEWSHLTRADSETFTRDLLRILKEQGAIR